MLFLFLGAIPATSVLKNLNSIALELLFTNSYTYMFSVMVELLKVDRLNEICTISE